MVEDDLIFDRASDAFEQNTTALPFQSCDTNSVDWRGEYEVANTTALHLSYIRCTQSSIGCLSCTPTREEWVDYKFSADCETLSLTHEDGTPRVYFPAKHGRRQD